MLIPVFPHRFVYMETSRTRIAVINYYMCSSGGLLGGSFGVRPSSSVPSPHREKFGKNLLHSYPVRDVGADCGLGRHFPPRARSSLSHRPVSVFPSLDRSLARSSARSLSFPLPPKPEPVARRENAATPPNIATHRDCAPARPRLALLSPVATSFCPPPTSSPLALPTRLRRTTTAASIRPPPPKKVSNDSE